MGSRWRFVVFLFGAQPEDVPSARSHVVLRGGKFCGQRIPNNGKYNWRIVRDEYHQMMGLHCPEGVIHDTAFTFNSLQASGVFDSE